MKNITIYIISILLCGSVLLACNSTEEPSENPTKTQAEGQKTKEAGLRTVHLSNLKFESLGFALDTLPQKALRDVVEANGQLEVPPQHEATVTAVVGANITDIKVIEGDKVQKGEVLAYVAHPDLIKIQTQYITQFQKLQYLKKEYARQQKLYDEKVGAGQQLQQTTSEYQAVHGQVLGLAAQLRQLHLNPLRVQKGELYEKTPVVSPIEGYVEKVLIQVGQYVAPQKELFRIVNNEHIHADLMVFEKDVHKVWKGQRVAFTVESVPGKVLEAEIYSVGKQFEQNPKAVHIHAEIKQKHDFLIPGMYINGKVNTSNKKVNALPNEAIIEEEGKAYLFLAKPHRDKGRKEWAFEPVEIKTGLEDEGWVEVKLLEPLPVGAKIAMNNAYYLISEMKKGSTEHGH